jgi:hypothetical protein
VFVLHLILTPKISRKAISVLRCSMAQWQLLRSGFFDGGDKNIPVWCLLSTLAV